MAEAPALRIAGARLEYGAGRSAVAAVDGVDLEVRAHETVGLVGESGCGKTTLARAILGLHPVASGSIEVDGRPVRGVSAGQAARVGMVWQDPYASLDPRWTVVRTLAEPGRLVGRSVDVAELMREVGLDPTLADRFPHQLSGGQRQRVAIGRALALRPPLLLCDEPTAALDLSIQAQILNLLCDVQAHTGCAILYISHDLATVRYLADRIAVMYLGQLVELGPSGRVFDDPRHPYTRTLLDAVPDPRRPGVLPPANRGEAGAGRPAAGCRFYPRCPVREDGCRSGEIAWSAEPDGGRRCRNPLKVS